MKPSGNLPCGFALDDARMLATAAGNGADTSRLLSELSGALSGDLAHYLAEHRARALRTSPGVNGGLTMARAHTKLYDGVLSTLFAACHAAMSQRGAWPQSALAAVGSYGRGRVSPFSDLDVRLLCVSDPAALTPIAEALLYPLWDAGLSIGHQVVAVQDLLDLAMEDVTTATTLLDLRTVAGDGTLAPALLERAYQSVFDTAHLGHFVDGLQERARARHRRFGDSVYLLEPDVKNGAGGLRDFDIAQWCAKARFKVTHLSQLIELGVLLPAEWAEVEQATNLLLEIRSALHLCAGRRTDRLTFDLQERVTERLLRGAGPEATERLMSDYYRGARVITRLADTLLSRARPAVRRRTRPLSLPGGLAVTRDAVLIERKELMAQQPELVFRLYDEAIRRDLPVCERTRHEIMHATANPQFCEALRQSATACQWFLRLLCVVQQTKLRHGSVLGELHDVGLLVAMIPEFGPVVGRVHRDTYHVYTVDVHSVAAVDHLRALCRGDFAAEHPLASRLAAELPRRRVVFLAALLHDVGKAYGGEGHSARGVEMAGAILSRLGVAPSDIVEVQSLIENHLCMYSVATRRDLEDPQTLGAFCAVVKDRQALVELCLLTVADVTTTNPTSMTKWKRHMLDTLFAAAERQLSKQGVAAAPRTLTVRANVLSAWQHEDRDFIEHFSSGLPERYFYANEPEAIVEHARFAQSAESRVASLRQGPVNHPYFELWVVADDRPGLLAMITATLSSAKLEVRSAQVYSWLERDGRSRSLDIFWVHGPQDVERVQRLLPKLERDLEQALLAPMDSRELARRALSGKRSPRLLQKHVAIEINVDNRSATDYTIIEAITQNRPALLFCLSNALLELELSIWFAKINTEGERVVDVFYVSNERGEKVLESAAIQRIRQALTAAVERLAAQPSGPGIGAPRSPREAEHASLGPAS
jgi:[protein-PII] uridylyltransferase